MGVDVNDFVRMTTDSKGKTTLKDVNADTFKNQDVEGSITKATVIENGKVGKVAGVPYNNDTLFLLYSAKDKAAKVYEGYKAVPTVKAADDAVVTDALQKVTNGKDGFAAVAVIYVDDSTTATKTEDAIYVLGDEKFDMESTTDGTLYNFKAVKDGKVITVSIDDGESVVKTLAAGTNVLLSGYEMDGNVMSAIEVAETDGVKINSYEAGVIDVDGKPYDAADAVVYRVTDGELVETTMKSVKVEDIKHASVIFNDDDLAKASAVVTVFVEMQVK